MKLFNEWTDLAITMSKAGNNGHLLALVVTFIITLYIVNSLIYNVIEVVVRYNYKCKKMQKVSEENKTLKAYIESLKK